ncbi:MAG: 23S rRNA (uracil(1939)-C(5))-methyltransferase RlmD [Candidatus Gracilibacteria bacterium]
MQLRKGQIIDLDIEKIAFGGNGLGKFEGRVVFVPGTMPGDKVKAAFTRIKDDFAEADLVEVVKKSPDRIEPKCKFFDKCGGCQLQFMPYGMQLQVKKQQVIDSFERIGKIKNPPVSEIIGCDQQYYYRNKMEFSFGYDEAMKFAIGMHLPGRRYDILDLTECFLESDFSAKIVNEIRDFIIGTTWPPFKYSIGEGFLQSLYIREGKRTNEVMVNLVTSDDIPEDFDKKMEECVEILAKIKDENNSAKKITSIYWTKVINKRGFPKQKRETLLYGKRTLTEKLALKNGDELTFEILPQAFFQVNTFQAEILYNQVANFALKKSHGTVFDLFCGTGTIGLFLAKHVEQVFGVELILDAVRTARENAQLNKIFNIDFLAGDVDKILHQLKDRPSLIVVDPPRAGLTKGMIGKMNEFDAKTIIYVSCNPATVARDCNLLSEYGYKVSEIVPVDMFPNSYHIECVCLLER